MGFLSEVPWYARLLRSRGIAVVHGNTWASRRSVVQAAAWCGVPYVQHVRNPVKGARARSGYHVASRIVTNSNAVAAELRADTLFADKTVTIYNAVDLARYDDRDDRRDELGARDRLVIGFVGQIVPRKGVTTLIQALPAVLARFPTAVLAVVGCPPPDETDYERECAGGAARSRRACALFGLSSRYPGVDAFVRCIRPADQVGPFGKVVIEAMAAGTPVVATHVGGIPEIVTGPELGSLVPPDDSAAVARKESFAISRIPRSAPRSDASAPRARAPGSAWMR